MLTLEFPVVLNEEQNERALRWLEVSKIIYNRALAELEEWDRQTGWYVPKALSDRRNEKGEPEPYYSAACKVPWEYRWDPISGTNVSFSRLLSDRSAWLVKDLPQVKVPQAAEAKNSWGWHGGVGYSCPCPCDYRQPLLDRWELQAKGGLGRVARGDYWFNDEVLDMPYKLRAGVLTTLETPWQEYLKSRMGLSEGPKRGKPRKKRKRDSITTIIHPNPKQAIIPVGETLTGVPGLGTLPVKGLSRRWRNEGGEIPGVATFKLCLQHDGSWRVQLTGAIERSFRVKSTTKAVGIDPGLAQEFSMSTGEQVAPKRFYRLAQKRRGKIQRGIAHKLDQNLILWLNHPCRMAEDIHELIRVKADTAVELMQCKSIPALVDLIGGRRTQQLRHGIPQSNRLKALQLRSKKLERKVGKQRKAEDEKLTTRIVVNHGAISIENGLQSQNLKAKAKPKQNEDGQGYAKNNAKAKAGLSKSLHDASPGRKIALLASKSKKAGRDFNKVAAPYTSIACPVSAPFKGFQDWVKEKHHTSNLDGDRMYRCDCGWSCDRDLNSGVNIELISFGGRLDLQLSDSAQRARLLSCRHSLTQPKGWKPHWAGKLSAKEWEDTRASVLASVPAIAPRQRGGKGEAVGGQPRNRPLKGSAGKAPEVLQLQLISSSSRD
jgi:putative transposase